MNYKVPLPEFMWHMKNFKGYMFGYLKKNYPEMKPKQIYPHKYILCERRETDASISEAEVQKARTTRRKKK